MPHRREPIERRNLDESSACFSAQPQVDEFALRRLKKLQMKAPIARSQLRLLPAVPA